MVTEKYADIYRNDMGVLGVLRPDLEPKATETIPEMIAMMERLIEAGHAYAAEGHVLFNVPSYADYGQAVGPRAATTWWRARVGESRALQEGRGGFRAVVEAVDAGRSRAGSGRWTAARAGTSNARR